MTMTHTTVNVSLLHDAFYMPQLHRTRRIWMYCPNDYDESDTRYPVIYMHDGQNLFDEATAFDKEWEIDETLESLTAQCIVIGIESNEHRMTEYNCNDNEKHGKGEGKAYIDFIVHKLKPYIDKHYKTLPDRDNTYMAGSSMGGLISLFGALYHPESFSKAGIFSPALWIVPNMLGELQLLAEHNASYSQQLFFYGGENEGGNMVQNIMDATELLKQYPQYSLYVSVDAEGEHSETCWRNVFFDFYHWLFPSVE